MIEFHLVDLYILGMKILRIERISALNEEEKAEVSELTSDLWLQTEGTKKQIVIHSIINVLKEWCPELSETDEEYLSPKNFCKKYPFITHSALRWIIFKEEENGATLFIRRLNDRRILINVFKFFEWIEKSKRKSYK